MKNTFKRPLALLLSVIMILSTAVPAFADDASLQAAAADLDTALQSVEDIDRSAYTEESLDELDALVSQITEERAAKQAAVDEAASELTSAEEAQATAQAVVDSGAFGFFEQMGSVAATNLLETATYKEFIEKGDPTDATSLENMKMSFELIKKCNDLRADNNLQPLAVSDSMMAMAMADADYADQNLGHPMQFGVGENLAWNWGSDPFYQWYDEEKKNYEEQNGGQTGHYLNIIDSDYLYTGLAICSKGNMYGVAFCQVFSDYEGTAGETHTVDEYETRFMTYYNEVTGALTTANDNLSAAQTAYTDAQDALEAFSTEKAAAINAAIKYLDESEEKSEYTITFNTGNINDCWIYAYEYDGGDLSEIEFIVESGGTLEGCFGSDYEIRTAPHLSFLGWSTEPGGEVVDLDTWVVNGDQTFYAVCREKPTCQITLHANGGVFQEHDSAVTITTSVIAGEPIYKASNSQDGPRHAFADADLPINADDSLTLDYWSLDEAGQDIVDFETYSPSEGDELWAQWGEAAYLTFIVGDEEYPVTHVVTDEVVLDDETPYYVGCSVEVDGERKDITGWRLDGEEEVYPSDTYTFPEGVKAATFYAVIEDYEQEVTYTWTFHCGAGSWADTENESISIEVEAGGWPQVPSTLIEPEGRVFLFWKTTSEPDPGHNYDIGSDSDYWTAESDREIWPQFSDYMITFDANGGTFNDGEDSEIFEKYVVAGECFNADEISDPSYLIPPEGMTFVNWADSEGNTAAYDEYLENGAQSNTTFYAVYEEGASGPETPTVTITFDANGGYFESYTVYNEETGKNEPASIYTTRFDDPLYFGQFWKPTAIGPEGKAFDSWHIGSPDGPEADSDDYFDADTTLYAAWTGGVTLTLVVDTAKGFFDKVFFNEDEERWDYEAVSSIEVVVPAGATREEAWNALDQPQSEDYVFWNWCSDEACTNVIEWDYQFNDDQIIYAQMQEKCTVIFDANGGSFGEEWVHDEETGEDYSRPATQYTTTVGKYSSIGWSIEDSLQETPDDQIFLYWSTDPEGENRIRLSEYVLTKDTEIFYAQYGEGYTVTFDAGEGWFNREWDDETETWLYTKERIVTVIPGESLENYVYGANAPEGKAFSHWSLSETGEDEIDDIYEYVPEGPVTIYAQYAEGYTVTLDAGNGTYYEEWYDEEAEEWSRRPVPEMILTVARGETIGERQYWPTPPEGMELSYWTTDPSDKDEDARIWDLYDYEPQGDVTIYAVYTTSLKITLDYNGGGTTSNHWGAGNTEYLTKNESYTNTIARGEPLSNVVFQPSVCPEGMRFAGWTTVKDDPSTLIQDVDEYYPEADMTVYALYKPGITITFKANGGHFTKEDVIRWTDEIDEESGQIIGYYVENPTEYKIVVEPNIYNPQTVYKPEPSESGKAFSFWSTAEDDPAQENKVEFDNYYWSNITEDLTVYAQYATGYKITYYANGGYFPGWMSSDPDVFVMTVPEGEYEWVDEPYEPSSFDFFDGWSTSEDGSDGYTAFNEYRANGTYEDLTFYAQYGKEMTLTFHCGEGYVYKWNEETEENELKHDFTYTKTSSENCSYETPQIDDDHRIFAYWTADPNTNERFDMNSRITEPMEFYAVYEDAHLVTYHAGPGYYRDYDVLTQKETKQKTRKMKVARSAPDSTRRAEGYYKPYYDGDDLAFSYWSIDEEGKTKAVFQTNQYNEEFILVNSDLDLYAQFAPAVTVTLDANGGYMYRYEVRTRQIEILVAKNEIVERGIENPRYAFSYTANKNGASFLGWSFERNGELIDFATWKPQADVTVYAKYDVPSVEGEESIYYYDFDANGGWFYTYKDLETGEEIKQTTQRYTYEAGSNNPYAPSKPYNDPGKTFLGWSETPNGEIVDPTDYAVDQDRTFYAIYRDCPKVTFYAGDGYILYYDDDNEEYIQYPTYITDTQAGWYPSTAKIDDPDLIFSYFAVGSVDGEPYSGPGLDRETEDIDFYAVYEPAYSVIYDPNEAKGGFFSDDEEATSYKMKRSDEEADRYVTAPAVESSVDGRTFVGWTTVKDDASTLVELNESGEYGPVTETVTLYALFEGGPAEADYTSVDAAIAAAAALDSGLYTEESWAALQTAINAVVRGKMADEQAAVDAMAAAINDAIAALVEKTYPLNVTNVFSMFKVAAATLDARKETLTISFEKSTYDKVFIGEASAVDEEKTTSMGAGNTYTFPVSLFTENGGAVNMAFRSNRSGDYFNRLLTLDVDALTLTTNKNDADYTAVDTALAAAGEVDRTLYTDESLAALDAAVNAVVTGHSAESQAAVAAMAAAINDAIAALVEKTYPLNVTNVFSMFKVAAATLDARKETLTISFEKSTYDKVFIGEASAVDEAKTTSMGEGNTYTFPVSLFTENGGAVNMAFRSNRSGEYFNRLLTLDVDALTLTTNKNDADYTAVDTALAAAGAVDRTLYTDESLAALDAAVNAVVTGHSAESQTAVNAMATAIENALDQLSYKYVPATFTVINNEEAITNLPATLEGTTYGNPEKDDYTLVLDFKFTDATYSGMSFGPTESSLNMTFEQGAIMLHLDKESGFLNGKPFALRLYAGNNWAEPVVTTSMTLDLTNKTITVGGGLQVIDNATAVAPDSAQLTEGGSVIRVAMADDAADQVFFGPVSECDPEMEEELVSIEDGTFEIALGDAAFDDETGTVNLAFHLAEDDLWTNVLVTYDDEAMTLTFEDNDADYTEVRKAADEALTYLDIMDRYTDASVSALEDALSEVVYGMTKDKQEAVDAMADAVNAAIKKMVLKTATAERVAGTNRATTSIAVAKQLKALNGNKKFDAVVLAVGEEFADSLAGGYLAQVKGAPILLLRGKKAADRTKVIDYVKANLNKNGTVYVLGSTAAIPDSWIKPLKSTFKNIKRLGGKNRFGTNAMILKEIGTANAKEIIAVDGRDFPDALCASATDKPLLTLETKKGKTKALTTEQKDFLASAKKKHGSLTIYMVGKKSQISEYEKQLKSYGTVVWISSSSDVATRSVAIANEFFSNPDTVALARIDDPADGLGGGVLAAKFKAPLLLTGTKSAPKAVVNYVADNKIVEGLVYGSTAAITDKTVRAILKNAKIMTVS